MHISGEKIRAARARRGWTQRQVALAVDTRERQVSLWEVGRAAPSAVYLLRLADALGVHPRELATPDAPEVAR